MTTEKNPLGLGARAPEESGTGSPADTSYDAYGSDPYGTGPLQKGDVVERPARRGTRPPPSPPDAGSDAPAEDAGR